MWTIRISRRVVFLLILGVLVAIPAGSWASHRFTDVDDTNIFHDDITWLADAEVTRGCNPPDNDEFCPSDGVTRQQMSAFMRRFAQYLDAEDGTPGQADNADTVDGLDASAFATDGHDHTGDDIVDGSLTGADIGDESVTGADIDNNSVSNADTSNEPGVVSNFSNDWVAATSTPTAMISTSIRVPSDGWVKIEVTGSWLNVGAGNDIAACQLQKGAVGVIGGEGGPTFLLHDRNAPSGLAGFSAHRVMPISVADNPPFITTGQSLHLVCDESGGDVRLQGLHISGTFFATSYQPREIIVLP